MIVNGPLSYEMFLFEQYVPMIKHDNDDFNVTRYSGYGLDIFNIIAEQLYFK